MTQQDIIQGCKRSDPRCQRELVLRYSGLLLTVCRRYMGHKDIARDVLQEAFIRIFKAIPKYQEQGTFVAWMRKIVINTALQHLQKRSLRIEATEPTELPEGMAIPDIYALLAAEELLSLIQQLPIGFRTVFNLYALEGYSHSEIGELLDISESTSRSQLMRARRWLQLKLNQPKKIRI